jgi:hypothetical protein
LDGGAAGSGPDAAAEARPEGGQLTVAIAADVNDALWLNGDDERLHYSATDLTLEVGTDAEIARTGLRFQISIPPRALISSAKLGLRSADLHTDSTSTMKVLVFDTVDVPPFSDLHEHLPEGHAKLAGKDIRGFVVCESGQVCVSPNIAELVQRIVDKPEWTGSGWIGFVLAPDDAFAASSWISFEDSAADGVPPTLEVVYGPPPAP